MEERRQDVAIRETLLNYCIHRVNTSLRIATSLLQLPSFESINARNFSGGTAFAMFEGAVIAVLREHKADYGLQRIYASIGGMISSPLSGMLIDYASMGKGFTDFR